MQAEQAQGKSWHPPGDADDEAIHVDLDEADASKAVERVKETRGEIARTDEADESPAEREWLDRSKAIRKRIGRLSRNYDQQRAEDHALFQRELAERDKRIQALESGRQGKSDQTTLEKELEQLEAQLADAHEKGESKEVARLTRLMAAKEREIWTAQQAKAGINSERDVSTPTEKATKPAGPTARGQAWIDGNLDWWDDEDFVIERQAAVLMHDRLVAAGSDPNSARHYAKLEEKLKAKFPKLRLAGLEDDGQGDDDLDEDEPIPPRREVRRAPVQAVQDRGNNGTQRRTRGMQLTADQISNMKRWGFDPNNNRDVMHYAATAAASAKE